MPNTPRGYPYPSAADPNDVPADIHALASAVDADVQDHEDAADPHPVYESSTEATTRMNTHIAAGHPTVPTHDASRHRFVGAKAIANVQIMYTNLAPPDQNIPFGAEEYDTDGIHSTSVATRKLTLPYAGYWKISFMLRAIADAGGVTLKNFRLRKNGTDIIRQYPDEEPFWLASGDSIVPSPETFHFAASDDVEIVFDPSGAGGTHITLAANANCQFAAEYLGA